MRSLIKDLNHAPLTAAALHTIESYPSITKLFARLPTTGTACSYFTFSRHDPSGFTLTSAAADLRPLWANHKDIASKVRANADPDVNIEEAAAKFAAQHLLIRQERKFVSDFVRPSLWANESDLAQFIRDPVGTIKDAAAAMCAATGLVPNVLGLAYDIRREVIAVLGVESPADLAPLLGLDEVITSMTIVKDSDSDSSRFLMSRCALLIHRPAAPSLMTAAAGYRLYRKDLTSLNDQGVRVFRVLLPTDEDPSMIRVDVESSSHPVLVAPELGHLFI